MKVLIVEDEARIREGIKKLIVKLDDDYEVVGEAHNGVEGIRLCRELGPDIIICDVRMPEMDGLTMLEEIYRDQTKAKAIVISAYSEFEYARSAMKLGITEYILKPISLNDFSKALNNVKEQIIVESRKKPKQVGTLEQILRDVIEAGTDLDRETLNYLENNYAITKDQSFVVLLGYLGSEYEAGRHDFGKKLKHTLSLYENIEYILLENEYRKAIVVIIYRYNDAHDLERWIQNQMLRHLPDKVSMGFAEAGGISGLREGIDALYPYMDWSISLKNDVLISYPKISNVQSTLCVYPIEIETQTKTALCTSDTERIKDYIDAFVSFFYDDKMYDPHDIKECYVRYIWSILEIAKELGVSGVSDIRQQRLLDNIMNAKTRLELNGISDYIKGIVAGSAKNDGSDTHHLTVKRAKSLINEFYNTGITLDEIAKRLSITPEYLGTQFRKETGVTFSNYIKNVRITKAKELLVGTSLKLYEISERVGYSDPKYFSKVFKDTVGMLPAEYRKTVK